MRSFPFHPPTTVPLHIVKLESALRPSVRPLIRVPVQGSACYRVRPPLGHASHRHARTLLAPVGEVEDSQVLVQARGFLRRRCAR